MDQSIRNKLRTVVTQCRKLLEEAVTQVLQGQFGISASGRKDDVHVEDETSLKLSAEDQGCRRDLVAHMGHIQALGYKAKDALAQLVREIAFTHLNRLCAYKMMEARGVWIGGKPFREAVSRGMKSQGFQFYLADDAHKEDKKLFDTGHQDVAYRHFLGWLGALLSEEIGVLFSPTDPANRLFPPQRVLDEVLALLNSDELKDIWSEDETIGWVYQYFTPKELRDHAREESAAPRNSYELAFRNQFFTPRYVVEFLTDNTLGRIWYEMRKGNTKLQDQCRFMVRRPNEQFLEHEQPLPQDVSRDPNSLSPEELFTHPVYVTHRSKKDPRQLKVLDPACGSGHFLLYCFDLLQTIYEEAFEDDDLGPKIKEDYPTLEDLRRDVPRLILAHNLHGIDIDHRASQIAALALWLRCQRAYRMMGIKKERPKISRSNIVCAEPMPGEKEMLREFVAQIDPKLLGQLVEIVFDKMRLAGEAGSLLKIEEEIRDAVAQARQQWLTGPVSVQRTLFGEDKPAEQKRFDFSGITDAQFFEQAEARVIDALRSYAEQTHNGRRLQRQLFADDAAQGFAFIDKCHTTFDVVLMNPPFGEMPERLLAYLTTAYPQTKYDLAPAFVQRALHWLDRGGRVGWIAPRTWFALSLLAPFRKESLYADNCLDAVLDLGIGVLDTALVEVACCTVQRGGRLHGSIFVARLLASKNKECDAKRINFCTPPPGQFVAAHLVTTLPRSAFGYWFPPTFAKHLQSVPRFDANGGEARQGLATTDDFRFLRCLWEVPPGLIGYSKRWVPFAKGGEYEPFYDDIHLVIDYADDGKNLKEYLVTEKRQKHWSRRIASSEYYGRPGLTYPERTTSDLSLRPLPRDAIFSATGQAVFLADHSAPLCYLGLSYTRLFKQILELYIGGGDASESGSAARHYTSGILNELKVPELTGSEKEHVESLVREAIELRRGEFSGVEETCDFCVPQVVAARTLPTLSQSIHGAKLQYRQQVRRLLEIAHVLDEWACRLYELPEVEGKAFLSEEVCPLPVEYGGRDVPADEQRALAACSIPEIVKRVCEKHGYRRAFTKKAYWANRRLELVAHLLETHPDSLIELEICDVTRHLAVPAFDVVSYSLGVVFGRWDIRVATGEVFPTLRLDPFAAVPAVAPGMLQGPDQLPARATPESYPLSINWDGIVPDDPDHSDDIVRRVRDVMEVVWKDRADAIEREAYEILGVRDLRDYFRKPGKDGFWDEHLSRYSKSRRNAPIYWLLQSLKKNYALWLYYHRLDKDILFKARQNYVDPKIRLEQTRLDSLRAQKTALGADAKGAKKIDKDIDCQETLLAELKDFAEKLERAAKLNFGNPERLNSDVVYDPDLNDGVVLNIAPLWELVPWKEAKSYWEELLEGKYEWSSMGKLLRKKGLVK